MGEATKITWCDSTFNPWRGCTKVSAGCTNCYAETLSHRNPAVLGVWGDGGTRVVASEAQWRLPLKWDREAGDAGVRRRVFCASLADVFEDRPELGPLRDRVFALMRLTPNLDWLTLTKRPEVMLRYAADPATSGRVAKAVDAVLVSEAARGIPERVKPYPEFPGYYVSNFGRFLTTSGAVNCLQCGTPLGGDPRSKYCGAKCKSRDHYERKHGGKAKAEAEPRFSVMSPDVGEQGHQRVMLYRGGESFRVLVHRAVLSVFDRTAPGADSQGCHRDGNPGNNHIANLRWGTQSDNWDDRKRHGNGQSYAKLIPQQVKDMRTLARGGEAVGVLADAYKVSERQVLNILAGRQWAEAEPSDWPPANWWAGVSVEDQAAADARIPVLLRIPAAVRFLSLEPLLGPVDLARWVHPFEVSRDEAGDDLGSASGGSGVAWAIVGGESGCKARRCNVLSVERVVADCRDAGVPVHVKQLGSNPGYTPDGPPWSLKDPHGADPEEWPEHLRVREMPAALALAEPARAEQGGLF